MKKSPPTNTSSFIWKKHRSVFDDHLRYVQNDVTNTYKERIIKYTEFMHEMINLSQYLSPTCIKGEYYRNNECKSRYEKFLEETIQKDIKCGLFPVISQDIEYNDMDYHTMDPEEWIN